MFKNRSPQNHEHSSNPEPEILTVLRGIEPRMLLQGSASVEDAHDKGRFVPATGAEYDVVGAVIEVDEIDPTKPMKAGAYPNMRYTAFVYNSASADKFNGLKASFSRSLGRVENGKQRTVNYDVLEDGTMTKSIIDFDEKHNAAVTAVELPTREVQTFVHQLDYIVAVEDLPTRQ